MRSGKAPARPGFSLIEMLVVLAIVAALAGVAAPVVTGAMARSKETALRQNLAVMRGLIDEFAADRGQGPESLETLLEEGYLRRVPPDPVNDNLAEWDEVTGDEGGLADVRSLSRDIGRNGVPYGEW